MITYNKRLDVPKRGFSPEEFEKRVQKTQKIMFRDKLDALFVTTPPNFRYFTGFDSQFWESPTRPWFLVVPIEGKPIAVIPEIGLAPLKASWLDDIRTWPAPNPSDDGISLLSATLEEVTKRFGRIGAELGREMSLRMPLIDFMKLRKTVVSEIVDGSPSIWNVRMIKTAAEITHIEHICHIVSDAFESLPTILSVGDTERDAARKLRIEILKRGADSIPFLPAISGPGGVSQIVSGPGDRVLTKGDVLFIDTGSTYDGYFCDFDRNFGVGSISSMVARIHETLWQATSAGINATIPGTTTEKIWFAINKTLENAGANKSGVGRLGHGVGLQLTEPPSHRKGEKIIIEENMVLTIEPGIEYEPGKMLVHEENIVVTKDGPRLLTRRAPREMPVIR